MILILSWKDLDIVYLAAAAEIQELLEITES